MGLACAMRARLGLQRTADSRSTAWGAASSACTAWSAALAGAAPANAWLLARGVLGQLHRALYAPCSITRCSDRPARHADSVLPLARAGYTPNTATRATTLVSELATLFRTAIRAAVPDVPSEPVLVQTNNAKFGDYQLNNAMRIFASLHGKVRLPSGVGYRVSPCRMSSAHRIPCRMSSSMSCSLERHTDVVHAIAKVASDNHLKVQRWRPDFKFGW